MKGLQKFLRHVLVWWLALPIATIVVICAFVLWIAGTQPGTRMLLKVVAQQLDGQVENVSGTLLKGLHADRLQLAFPGTAVDVTDLTLVVDWRALRDRLLRVKELSAQSVQVALTTVEEEAPTSEEDKPFVMPEFPVKLAVDRVALGTLDITQDAEPLPVSLADIAVSLGADNSGARLNIHSFHVAHEQVLADLQGQAELMQLRAPWPVQAALTVKARSVGPDSPLCASRMVTAPRVQNTAECAATITIKADSSTEHTSIDLNGATADGALTLVAQAQLALDQAFPVKTAKLDMRLADQSGVNITFDRQAQPSGDDRVTATLDAQRLNIGDLVGPAIPPALLTARMGIEATVADMFDLKDASVQLSIADTSRWNKQVLAGTVSGRVIAPTAKPVEQTAVPPLVAEVGAKDPLAGFQLQDVLIDLKLGTNTVKAKGALNQGRLALSLDAEVPKLDAFWPDIPGGGAIKASLDGSVDKHKGQLTARYVPADGRKNALGSAPLQADLAFAGGWGSGTASTDAGAVSLVGWRGKIERLTAESMKFTVGLAPTTLSFLPDAVTPQWQWDVGATQLTLGLPDKQRIVIAHQGSRGGPGRWQTAGRANNLVITTSMVKQILQAVDPEAAEAQQQVNTASATYTQARIALDAAWDLKFAGALSGTASIAHRDGDLRIPGDPPIPVGLKKLNIDVRATPTGGGSSRLNASIDVDTQKMGQISATAVAALSANAAGAIGLDQKRPIRATVNASMQELSWLDSFVGDTMEVRGKLEANIEAQGTLDGKWNTSGTIKGRELRVIRIDDGVRLLEGTLDARLEGTKVILESLRFPATLRVLPDEWRTKEWVTENPDAKGGYAEATGQWDLLTAQGDIRLKLYRFPALQRSDRYAMVSGDINVDAKLPRVSITGDLTADAGWFSLDILQGVPSLDDDVHVIKPGDAEQARSSPLQMSMNLKFDMGPRFYITGMGLDAGIIGSLEIHMADGRLTGVGALRTRGGGIEAYGQKLRLRRGVLTFQGRLDNPLLDIEALRTGEQVEAGVRVSGTAQRPKIDLISYPDVSDVEKLSWLILGRGPDESGSDAALLMSIGSALLGGGEPFYKQFGLDDVSIRSGAIGSSGSLLPDRTVASQISSTSDSDLATQFLVASKNFANGITLSVEQAMAGSETVGRASYQLSRRWSVDLKGGSVNGIALVYRAIFAD